MDAWKIVKDRSQAEKPCCKSSPNGEYWAVLELPACSRRDLCAVCFREYEAAADKPVLFWRGRRRKAKGPVLDLTSLRLLFDRLGEEQEPDRAETAAGLRYLVALLLLRKRLLKMVDARNAEEERADLVVVDPKIEGMEPVALSAPPLDSERLESLKGELAAVLGEEGALSG